MLSVERMWISESKGSVGYYLPVVVALMQIRDALMRMEIHGSKVSTCTLTAFCSTHHQHVITLKEKGSEDRIE